MAVQELLFWSFALAIGLLYSGYYVLCKYVVKTKKFNVDKDGKFRPKISFIIPTWNEENTIEGKIKNTLAINYPRKKLEIIVFDSASTDSTRKIVKKYRRVKLITEERRCGKASALNKAFKIAKGDVVVISDSDCRLRKDILLKSVPYFNDPCIGAVTGRESIINPEENTATKSEKTYRSFFYLIRQAESILDSTYVFDGPFCAFRKELLDKINTNCVADDSELAMKINKKGYRALSIPEAVYFEFAPSKFSDRTKQKSRRAEGLIQSMISYIPTFFLNRDYGLFGMFIFPIGVLMHIISPFLLIGLGITLFLLPINMLAIFLFFLLVGMVIPKSRHFILTFLNSQYSCLVGVLKYLVAKPNYSWEKIVSTRRYGAC